MRDEDRAAAGKKGWLCAMGLFHTVKYATRWTGQHAYEHLAELFKFVKRHFQALSTGLLAYLKYSLTLLGWDGYGYGCLDSIRTVI